MATKKKVETPEKVKVKRFEVGYRFPVMAEITIGPENGDSLYNVEVTLEDYSGHKSTAEVEVDEKGLMRLELVCNPNAEKEYLAEKLKEAQAVVAGLTKRVNELK